MMKDEQFLVYRLLLALGAAAILLPGCTLPPGHPGLIPPARSATNEVATPPAGPGELQFAVLSDLHFNPFLCANRAYTNLAQSPSQISWPATLAAYEAGTDAALDHPEEDASYHLIRSALQNLTNRCAHLAFVLGTGDYYAHESQLASDLSADEARFDEYRTNEQVQFNYVVNSEALVAQMLKSVGLTNVFPTLGNNDSEGDYLAPSPAFLREFANGWRACTPPGAFGPAFPELGCFAANVPGLTGCRILSFNTSLFSRSGTETKDSRRAMRWLADDLATHHGRTILLYHIPPGLNYFSGGTPFWHADVQHSFLSLLASNHDEIIGSFCSHTHNDEFRLVYAQGRPVHFIHLSPSISPVHGNTPAYQIFTATTSGRIVGYATYYLAGFPGRTETWQPEYTFSTFTNAYNEATLAGLFFSAGSANLRDTFHSHYYAPGLSSADYDAPGYWRTARLDAP